MLLRSNVKKIVIIKWQNEFQFNLPDVTIQQLFAKQFQIFSKWIGPYFVDFGLIA